MAAGNAYPALRGGALGDGGRPAPRGGWDRGANEVPPHGGLRRRFGVAEEGSLPRGRPARVCRETGPPVRKRTGIGEGSRSVWLPRCAARGRAPPGDPPLRGLAAAPAEGGASEAAPVRERRESAEDSTSEPVGGEMRRAGTGPEEIPIPEALSGRRRRETSRRAGPRALQRPRRVGAGRSVGVTRSSFRSRPSAAAGIRSARRGLPPRTSGRGYRARGGVRHR